MHTARNERYSGRTITATECRQKTIPHNTAGYQCVEYYVGAKKKSKAHIFSLLLRGVYALKISFQFLAQKKAFFPVRFSLVLYVFYSRQLGFLFKICGSLVFVSCQGKRSYSSSMPYSLSRPANSSTSSRACSYVTSNSSVSRWAISSSVKPPFSIICQM